MPQKNSRVALRKTPQAMEEVSGEPYEFCRFLVHDDLRNVYIGRTLDEREALITGDDIVEFDGNKNFKEKDFVWAKLPHSNSLAKAHIKSKRSNDKFVVELNNGEEMEMSAEDIAHRYIST
ncbi:hypothetical protein GEMRC1_002378 [Eukaryota sp. GEM-RC1]